MQREASVDPIGLSSITILLSKNIRRPHGEGARLLSHANALRATTTFFFKPRPPALMKNSWTYW
jgi:hypothetical protein